MAHYGSLFTATTSKRYKKICKRNARIALGASHDGGVRAKVAIAFLLAYPDDPFYIYKSCYDLGVLAREGMSQYDAQKYFLESPQTTDMLLSDIDNKEVEADDNKTNTFVDAADDIVEVAAQQNGVQKKKMTKKEFKRLAKKAKKKKRQRKRSKRMTARDVRDCNIKTIFECGGVFAIFNALEVHQRNVKVQTNACFALTSLIASDYQEHRDMIISACSGNVRARRGEKVIQRAIRQHRNNKDLQRNAAFLLCAMRRESIRPGPHGMNISEDYRRWCAIITKEELDRIAEEETKKIEEEARKVQSSIEEAEAKKAMGFSHFSWAKGGFDLFGADEDADAVSRILVNIRADRSDKNKSKSHLKSKRHRQNNKM